MTAGAFCEIPYLSEWKNEILLRQRTAISVANLSVTLIAKRLLSNKLFQIKRFDRRLPRSVFRAFAQCGLQDLRYTRKLTPHQGLHRQSIYRSRKGCRSQLLDNYTKAESIYCSREGPRSQANLPVGTIVSIALSQSLCLLP
jgi:hypothetical protein